MTTNETQLAGHLGRCQLSRLAIAVASISTFMFAMALPAAASVNRTVPEDDLYGPIYARSLHVENPDSTWIPIIFYRPVSCVPSTYDLVALIDLSAWSCPLTVAGHVIYDAPDDPQNFRPPSQVRLHGDGVPIWFVSRSDWEDAGGTADFTGSVTLAEVEAMPSLLTGTASYREVLHPGPTFAGGGATVVKDLYHASGVLEDGRTFLVNVGGRLRHGDDFVVANYRLSTWQVRFD